MTWAQFSDDTPDDPILGRASDAAFRLWFDAHCHCAAKLTDGELTRRSFQYVLNDRPISLAAELVDLGLWEAAADGYRIVGYLDQQPSREFVEQRKSQARERQRSKRERDAKCAKGDHSLCRFCRAKRAEQGVSRVTSPQVVTRDVTAPDPLLSTPTRPRGRGGVERRSAGADAGALAPAERGSVPYPELPKEDYRECPLPNGWEMWTGGGQVLALLAEGDPGPLVEECVKDGVSVKLDDDGLLTFTATDQLELWRDVQARLMAS